MIIKKETRVGVFGRTNLGEIIIFAYLVNSQGERYKNKVILSDGEKIINELYYFEKEEKILKESSNIIDIIEKGDYVNGERVVEVVEASSEHHKYIVDSLGRQIFEENINSIITKEKMAEIQYDVI